MRGKLSLRARRAKLRSGKARDSQTLITHEIQGVRSGQKMYVICFSKKALY